MARITIYIPDERMTEIDRLREDLNFSQLFIEAFDRAAQSKQITKLKDSEMKTIVDRLKKSYEKSHEKGWKEGVKLGNAWAKNHAHLSNVKSIGEGRQNFDHDKNTVDKWLNWYYEFWGYIKSPDDEIAEIQLEKHVDLDAYIKGKNLGFVEAVKNIWEEIKTAFPD